MGSARSRPAVRVVGGFSLLAQHGAIWLALGLAGERLDPPRAQQWRRGWCTVAASYAINQTIKLIVRRPRPSDKLVWTPSDLSFPSAHATTSFAAARAYAPLLPQAAPALYALACAFGLSRLYMRVHHRSDVIAGALIGDLIARAAAASAPAARGGAPAGRSPLRGPLARRRARACPEGAAR